MVHKLIVHIMTRVIDTSSMHCVSAYTLLSEYEMVTFTSALCFMTFFHIKFGYVNSILFWVLSVCCLSVL